MATLTLPRTARKAGPGPERHVNLLARPEPGAAGYLELTVNATVTGYHVECVPCAWGEAFRLEKLDAGSDPEESVYHVCFQEDGYHSCECKGFLRWGHCVHVDSLAALRERHLL